MLTHFSELVIRVADLVEAEGRELRRVVARVGTGFSFVMLASGLFLIGCALVLAGMWLALADAINTAGASALTGAAALGLGWGALKWSERYHQ